MGKSINLIIGCHSHQPVGNFDFVFEEAYEKSYKPYLDVLDRFPEVHCTLHYTGPLYDWCLEHRPEFIERLRAMVERGQVEIMGGAYYEPLLCAIPERDAIAQLRRMKAFCLDKFGQEPKGAWLTERVWEPRMASTLGKAGIDYTALDDAHFLCSGLQQEDMFGYYLTEDEGYALKCFPILEHLRYIIPFHPVHETIDFLRDNATEDGLRCAVIHDDGEKFGVWPETFRSVYEEGWLESFFQALTDNREWIHCLTYQEYMEKAAAAGRTYITCASYEEMMRWSLPPDMQRRLVRVRDESKHSQFAADYDLFLRTGFWRNFLARYPESNNIQKRMFTISRRLDRLRGHANQPALSEAEQLLHMGQCNCAYWHGVFGGLYLNHLRTALYQKLIAADHVLDQIEYGDDMQAHVRTEDFNADGLPEIILTNPSLWVGMSPHDGGTIFELDYKPKPFNFVNTLSRRDESYHDDLRSGAASFSEGDSGGSIHELNRAKEAGLEHYLVYDPYRRVSLRDHLLPGDVEVEALWANTVEERAPLATAWYDHIVDGNTVTLATAQPIDGGHGGTLHVKKQIAVSTGAPELEIRYTLRRDWGELQPESDGTLRFAVEFVVNYLTGSADDRYMYVPNDDSGKRSLGEHAHDKALKHIALRDDWQRLECSLDLSRTADVYRFPIETVSSSEGGQERTYQGTVLMVCWDVQPGQGEAEDLQLTLSLQEV